MTKKSKKKSFVPVAKIKKNLRKLSLHSRERAKALNRTKVAPATYACESCGQEMYDGSSDKNFQELKKEYPKIIKEKPQLDHKVTVEDPKEGWISWDVYLERLFCGPEGYNVLCKKCHQEVTKEEIEERVKSGTLKRK